MVDTVEIGRVTLRDNVSLDLSVWMNDPDDWDFRPTLSYAGNTLTIRCANQGTVLASVDLDDEQDEALQPLFCSTAAACHAMMQKNIDLANIVIDFGNGS